MHCPNCGQDRLRWKNERQTCTLCGWKGDIHVCHPQPLTELPALAGPDDALCANHPLNKAIATCAATGDYICALCRVEVDGNDYSIQYLDRKGDDVFTEELRATVPRPDKAMRIMMWLCLISLCFSPFFWLVATLLWRRAARQRRESELYRMAAAGKRPWLYWCGATVFAIVSCGLFFFWFAGELTIPPYPGWEQIA